MPCEMMKEHFAFLLLVIRARTRTLTRLIANALRSRKIIKPFAMAANALKTFVDFFRVLCYSFYSHRSVRVSKHFVCKKKHYALLRIEINKNYITWLWNVSCVCVCVMLFLLVFLSLKLQLLLPLALSLSLLPCVCIWMFTLKLCRARAFAIILFILYSVAPSRSERDAA